MLHGVTQSVAVDSPAAQVSVFVGCAVATVHVASAKKSGREDRPAWLSHRSLHRIAQFQVGLCQSQRRNLNQSDPTRSQPVAACRPRCMPTLLNRSALETYYRLPTALSKAVGKERVPFGSKTVQYNGKLYGPKACAAVPVVPCEPTL